MRMHARLVAVSAALVSLYGCGGGGGDNNDPPAPAPVTYTLGGTVGGLAGSGLVLTLNGGADLTVGSNGNFTFPGALASGASYSVAVKTQPANPSQTCVATSASGTVSAAVSNISVSCTTNSYAVGGAVGGLTGSGMILSLNDEVELAIGVSGNFTFPGTLESGSSYTVEVQTQPTSPSQTCAVTNSSGTVGGNVVSNISVACTTNSYSVSGSVTGLTGSGLALRLNGATATLPVSANGSFTFPTPVASGSNYSVTIPTQPVGPRQTCLLTNGSGVVGNAAPTISVNCTTDMYSVGGTISGLTGPGLILQLNGSQDLPIASNGAFEFPTRLLSGQQYAVTVSSQTSTHRELCAATNATGSGTTVNATTVKVECAVVLGFVYVVGNNGQVLQYGVRPDTGALLPIGAVATVAGISTTNMVVAPNGGTIYASDIPSSAIYAFSVDQNKGRLSAAGAPLTTGSPGWGVDRLAITPSGDFLYATHLSAGTIHLLSIDPGTGALLTSQSVVATGLVSGSSAIHRVAMTPDGAFLYVLSYATYPSTPAKLDTFAIDAATGALSVVATSAPGSVDGLSIDPLGRFLYLRNSAASPDVTHADTTLYPYTIDAATGALTPVATTTTVESNGEQMVFDPTGRYAYLLGAFNYRPVNNHIDVFSVDQSTGVLTVIGTPVLVQGVPNRGLACDATGRFLFLGNSKSAGTFSPSAPYDASTFPISGAGPTEGQLSPPGSGGSTAAVNRAIAVVQ